jgi:predicted nicotinamide N-methyase
VTTPAAGGPIVVEHLELEGRSLTLVRPRSVDAVLDRAVAAGVDEPPYWADLWPSALVLARHLAARDLRGRRVLELGCGLALPALAAAAAGADVLATDAAAPALALAAESGRRTLGRPLATLVADLTAPPAALRTLAPFDLVVAADVLYDARLEDALGVLLPALVAPGGEALVAYPWREQANGLAAVLEAGGLRSWHEGGGPWLLRARGRPLP